MNLELNEIFSIIDKVKSAELETFEYSDAVVKIKIKNAGAGAQRALGTKHQVWEPQDAQFAQAVQNAQLVQSAQSARFEQLEQLEHAMTGQQDYRRNASAQNARASEESCFVEAPMVGTFYRAGAEDAEPFVAVGDSVKKGQVIGIIEAMKLMNEIQSDTDGIVEEILVENEELVEYGQPLLRIKKVK